MFKKISVSILVLALSTSCVSKKIFNELESKFSDLKKENRHLADTNDSISKLKNKFETESSNYKTELDKTKAERDKLLSDYTVASKNLKTLQDSYKALEKNSDESLQNNLTKNRELLAQLEGKEKMLAAEQERFNKTKADLNENAKRLAELESIIAAKEASMKKLKETLAKSLKAFDGKGLTVQQRDGKVYVSMENKLLFESGSYAVNPQGKTAVGVGTSPGFVHH